MMRKRSSFVPENGLFLHEDVLCKIWSWLGVKSLLRCKSVCKVWNAAIVDNIQFIDMHAIHNGCRSHNIRRGYSLTFSSDREILDDGKPLKRTFYFDVHVDDNLDSYKREKKFNFISCRGLLVEGYISRALTILEIKYRIYNPTTKRVLDLPNPQKSVIVMRVFLDSSTNSYHVVSLYTDKTNNVKFELIDLGGQSNDPCPNGDLSWRALNIPDFDVANILQKYDCLRCVLEEGILFMPALVRVVSSNPIIVCVDLLQQACTTLNVPESVYLENREVHFQLWKGKPALSFVSEEKLNVWIVEDYKRQKWADPIQISLPSLDGYPCLRKQIPRIYQGDEEDYFLAYKLVDPKFADPKFLVCKIGSEVLSDVPASPPIRVPASFVSVKGMRPQNMKDRNIEHQTTTRSWPRFTYWIGRSILMQQYSKN